MDVMVQSLLQRLRYFHAWPCRKTMHLGALCPGPRLYSPSHCFPPSLPGRSERHGAQLKEDDVVCITEANISSIEDSKVLIVAGMDLVGDREPSSPAPCY